MQDLPLLLWSLPSSPKSSPPGDTFLPDHFQPEWLRFLGCIVKHTRAPCQSHWRVPHTTIPFPTEQHYSCWMGLSDPLCQFPKAGTVIMNTHTHIQRDTYIPTEAHRDTDTETQRHLYTQTQTQRYTSMHTHSTSSDLSIRQDGFQQQPSRTSLPSLQTI